MAWEEADLEVDNSQFPTWKFPVFLVDDPQLRADYDRVWAAYEKNAHTEVVYSPASPASPSSAEIPSTVEALTPQQLAVFQLMVKNALEQKAAEDKAAGLYYFIITVRLSVKFIYFCLIFILEEENPRKRHKKTESKSKSARGRPPGRNKNK
jgi:hypothetical protein